MCSKKQNPTTIRPAIEPKTQRMRRAGAVLAKRALERAVAFYGRWCPIEKGKLRAIQWYINWNRFELHRDSELKRWRRRGFWFDLDLTDYVDQWIYLTGYYERADYLELLNAVRQKAAAVVFDVGAQIGVYTLGLSRAVGSGGTVYSFEPNPRSFGRLQQHVQANKCDNVVLNQLALGEKCYQATLQAPLRFNTGGATLLRVRLPESWQSSPVDVGVVTLDQYCEKNHVRRLDAVKLDCQGYEPFVIEGGRNMLKTWHPRLLIEFDSRWLGAAGWSGDAFLGLLRELGYEPFQLWRGRLRPITSVLPSGEAFNIHCLSVS
jgi:FkbM family methyltransferase